MLGTLMRFLPTMTQIFLWWAIYDVVSTPGTGDSAAGPDGEIAGFKFGDIIAYYLLVIISRAFSSMPGLTGGIANQIRNGEIKKFLIQPVDMQGCLLMQRIAHKLVYYLIAALPFALVFFLCRDFFVNGWPAADVLVVYFLSLLFAFLLGFFLETCFGLIGFWFLEVTSLTFIYMLMNFLLSGHMFPLDLLPSEPVNIRAMVEFLPFKYLAYFPAAVFLGKIEGPEMYRGLMVEVVWVLFFLVLSRVLWWKGIKRYSGFGG
jgi:ABC-2 type transport system permease protein